jgi:hypothetical protein
VPFKNKFRPGDFKAKDKSPCFSDFVRNYSPFEIIRLLREDKVPMGVA